MKYWKCFFGFVTGICSIVLIAVCFFPSAAMEEDESLSSGIIEEENVIASGSVSDTVSWRITEDEDEFQTLIISGTGPMADYKERAEQPWLQWSETIDELIVEDGITRIGNYSMNKMGLQSVQIGADVEAIGRYAFATGYNLSQICIPGNVKVLEVGAFHGHKSLDNVILEEGVEILNQNSLSCGTGTGISFHIPASLTEFHAQAVWLASEYTIAEGNSAFSVVDGVLYSKDGSVLIDYPKYKKADEYRIPDTVCEIKDGALQCVTGIKLLYVPSSVQILPVYNAFQRSSYEEVYIEDGVPISGYATFYTCSNLVRFRMPEDMPISNIYNIVGYGCDSLQEITITNGVKQLEYIGSPLKSLEHVVYDAANAKIIDRVLLDENSSYQLVIGEHVDVIPAQFYRLSAQATEIIFQVPNQLTIESGAVTGQESPLDGISGIFYIDEQGIMYRYDTEALTAEIVYFQEGQQDLFVPSSIYPEENVECKVISVCKDAFRNKQSLRSITFEKPEQIVSVEAYAFAESLSLVEVNGCVTIESVKANFGDGQAQIGYRAFYNTGLSEEEEERDIASIEDMLCYENLVIAKDSADELTVTVQSEGETIQWKETEDDGLGYELLTGDTLRILAAAGNRQAQTERKYRIYFRWTQEDCSLSIVEGNTYTFDGQSADCVKTEDPYSVYLEFSPDVGKTLSIPVTAVYPSPSSSGGELYVWAVALEEEEADEKMEQLVYSEDGVIKASWETQRDSFTLTKTSHAHSNIPLRGTSDGRIIPEVNLEWNIVFQRENDVISSYGKDYVKNVTYTDSILLPEGLNWSEEVKTAAQEKTLKRNGNTWLAGEQGVFYTSLSGGSLSLTNMKYEWNEELETIQFSFRVLNTQTDAEMNTNKIGCILYAGALEADAEQLTEEPQSLTNQVDAIVAYQHSEKEGLTSSASKSVYITTGTVKMDKSILVKPVYFGEQFQYQITVSNTGAMTYYAADAGSWVLVEKLSPYSCLEAEDMEKMFDADVNKQLSIEVSGVSSIPWKEKQGIYENTVFWENGSNTGVNEELSGDTIQIGWNLEGSGYLVTVGTQEYEGDSLKELLCTAGYSVGRWCEYTLKWSLNENSEIFQLKAGEIQIFPVYGRAKNTFQMLSFDWNTYYPTEAALTLNSNAYLFKEDGTAVIQKGVGHTVVRECRISKNVYRNGEQLKDSYTVENGNVLTYSLQFAHYGKGIYENLPIVDNMYGAQALLVSVEKNKHLSGMGLDVYEDEGENYYVLTEGEYLNVRIGGSDNEQDYIAARIAVENVSEEQGIAYDDKTYVYTGLSTRIEWNCPELPSGRYKMYLSYKAVVDQRLAGTNVYTLGNIVWMNDKIGSRIYSGIWGGGTIIDFDKEILNEKGTDGKEDTVDEDDYTILQEGETVTYRLLLRNKGDGEYVVNGKDLCDMLPSNKGIFLWEKGTNVDVFYESTHSSTEISGLENWYLADCWKEQEAEGQQYLLWQDDAFITFKEQNAKVYIYVKLTYPDNEEGQWKQYCKAVDGTLLENTFYVYLFPVNVTHHLGEPGEILLQKGVYGTSYGARMEYQKTQSRYYYNNKDSKNRQVIYYIVLYNGGAKRWYLNDVYDELPEGFTMERLLCDTYLNRNEDGIIIQTATEFDEDRAFVDMNGVLADNEEVQYRNATIRWQETEKEGRICFQISGGEEEDSLSYDVEREQYYLNRNEAIVFGYMCSVGCYTETKETAGNTACMYYSDYPKTGVQTVSRQQLNITGIIDEQYGEQNDGECAIVSGEDIREQYDLIYGSINDEWLLSEVAVTRGSIIPGITKYTESYVVSGSTQSTEYKNAVGPSDQINWRVRLHNSGTLAITDYTFEDILPSNYVFCGDISYNICDYSNNLMSSFKVAEILERTEDTVTIYNNLSRKILSLDGTEEEISMSSGAKGTISVEKKEDGSETMTIHFADAGVSIPEGGYIDVYLSSYNPTNQYQNTVYTNRATLTPNVQKFSGAAQGSLIRDENGKAVSVKSSAPVTVSYGYATGSCKSVMEKTKEENEAVSTNMEDNYILLSGKDSSFTYKLTVCNDTEKAMEKLILIDSLPQPGDSSLFDVDAERGSEFTVYLADDPQFRVEVYLQDGTVYELTEEEYSVDYTDKMSFVSEDWSGTSVWNGTQKEARAIRIAIYDTTGEKIPANAEVVVCFDCIAEENTVPGTIAWNSFGYHYKLLGLSQELEAMTLPVGVKIPNVPKVKKSLIDMNGNAYMVDEETSFNFVVCEGEGTETEECLRIAVTIEKGESSSQEVLLDQIEWKEGVTYTIYEETDSVYVLDHINGLNVDNYSFFYEKSGNPTIHFVNICLEWEIELQKVDSQDHSIVLANAEFTLKNLTTGEVINGTTDETGEICWSGLRDDKYYLKEITPPDGYNLAETGQVIYWRQAEGGKVSVKFENEKGSVFPETGGFGVERMAAVGMFVMLFAGTGYYFKRKDEMNEI